MSRRMTTATGLSPGAETRFTKPKQTIFPQDVFQKVDIKVEVQGGERKNAHVRQGAFLKQTETRFFRPR